jgi:ArsR family transcriptional regulator, lead/cadmium/zinc/bismuth-responsive transcriptional repressor
MFRRLGTADRLQMNLPATSYTEINGDETLARAAQEHLLDGVTATRVAAIFAALGDPTRVRIISLLAHAELCVGDLCLVLGMNQPAVSHQLRLLRTLDIVTARKQGKNIFYTLADAHIHDLFHQGLAHVQHD